LTNWPSTPPEAMVRDGSGPSSRISLRNGEGYGSSGRGACMSHPARIDSVRLAASTVALGANRLPEVHLPTCRSFVIPMASASSAGSSSADRPRNQLVPDRGLARERGPEASPVTVIRATPNTGSRSMSKASPGSLLRREIAF
jgi:hypothetical protein